MTSPYETLGVKSTDDKSDIKKAYKKLASKYHPDKKTGDEDKFKTIQDAYDKIKNGDVEAEATFSYKPDGMWDKAKARRYEDTNQYWRAKSKNKKAYKTSINIDELHDEIIMNVPDVGKVRIPKGVTNGQSIYAGDEKITIEITANGDKIENFKALHQSHDVTFYTGLSSIQRNFQTIIKMKNFDGEILRFKVPSFHGDKYKFRLDGKGLPRRDGTRGDLIISIYSIDTPLSQTFKRGLMELGLVRDEIDNT